jgi:hypothetical protein
MDHPLLRNPFGFGPRMCLGSRIADLEIQSYVGRLFRGLFIFKFPYSFFSKSENKDWRVTLADPNATYEVQQKMFCMADPYPAFQFEQV